MGIGISIVLVAVGAVLTFVLEREAAGPVGMIMMSVGIGLVVSMLFQSSARFYGPVSSGADQ